MKKTKVILISILTVSALNAFDFNNFVSEKKDKLSSLISQYEAAIDKSPYVKKIEELAKKGNEKSYFYLGAIYEKVDKNKAIKYYKKALEVKDYRAAYNLGLLYLKNGNIMEAKTYFELAYNNGIQEAILPLAEIKGDKKLYKEAVDKKIPGALERYVIFLKTTNDPEYNKIIKNIKKESKDYVLIAEDFINKNKLNKAIEVLKEGVKNLDEKATVMLADIYSKENPKEALKLVENIKENPYSDFIKGKIFFQEKDYKKALDSLRKYQNSVSTDQEKKLADKYIKSICENTNYCLDF